MVFDSKRISEQERGIFEDEWNFVLNQFGNKLIHKYGITVKKPKFDLKEQARTGYAFKINAVLVNPNDTNLETPEGRARLDHEFSHVFLMAVLKKKRLIDESGNPTAQQNDYQKFIYKLVEGTGLIVEIYRLYALKNSEKTFFDFAENKLIELREAFNNELKNATGKKANGNSAQESASNFTLVLRKEASESEMQQELQELNGIAANLKKIARQALLVYRDAIKYEKEVYLGGAQGLLTEMKERYKANPQDITDLLVEVIEERINKALLTGLQENL